MSWSGIDVIRLLDTGERDALGNVIVQGCPFPEWCRFTPGPLHRHSIIETGEDEAPDARTIVRAILAPWRPVIGWGDQSLGAKLEEDFTAALDARG